MIPGPHVYPPACRVRCRCHRMFAYVYATYPAEAYSDVRIVEVTDAEIRISAVYMEPIHMITISGVVSV